ncbi:hypothetical protein [Nannocystis sp.]|uniref:hypothetical protein n=1 Tax=Nannocystis sp. TaxID=1962667 RepID=UPI0024215A4C|nr:hypothetical protein [Nannocystis sp.]MBK7830025.1 hypothetical protein [Nannocystis sp.]MBK9752003.1 hypothetical protein [Nannocystis sp.]
MPVNIELGEGEKIKVNGHEMTLSEFRYAWVSASGHGSCQQDYGGERCGKPLVFAGEDRVWRCTRGHASIPVDKDEISVFLAGVDWRTILNEATLGEFLSKINVVRNTLQALENVAVVGLGVGPPIEAGAAAGDVLVLDRDVNKVRLNEALAKGGGGFMGGGQE